MHIAWRVGTLVLAAVAGAVVVAVAAPPPPAAATRITATCSDSPADAGVLNAAIAGSAPGDEIVFDGPCLIDQTIKLLGDRAYRGQSRTGTVLRQADGANLDAILASDSYLDNEPTTGSPVSVRQLTLQGNKDHNDTPTNGIIVRSWQTTIEDLQISDMGGNGILFTNPSADGTLLTNTSVNGQIVGNFIEHSGANGILVRDPGNSLTDWNLTGNWIGSSGRSGIYLENAAGWVVERNHVYGVPEDAIYADRLWGTSISDNYIEGFGETPQDGRWYGIEATVQGGTASTIAGNRVFNSDDESNEGSTYRYIGISRVNYGSGVVSVTGNAIRGASTARGTGLYYAQGGGDGLTVASTGNVVSDIGTAVSRVGPNVVVTRGR